MLCLSGFELYSRWVPLKVAGLHMETINFPFLVTLLLPFHFVPFNENVPVGS